MIVIQNKLIEANARVSVLEENHGSTNAKFNSAESQSSKLTVRVLINSHDVKWLTRVQNELTSAKLRFQTAESKVIEMEQMLAEARAIKNKTEHQAEELDRQLRASKQEVSKVELIVESREARILELEEEMKMVRTMTITIAN